MGKATFGCWIASAEHKDRFNRFQWISPLSRGGKDKFYNEVAGVSSRISSAHLKHSVHDPLWLESCQFYPILRHNLPGSSQSGSPSNKMVLMKWSCRPCTRQIEEECNCHMGHMHPMWLFACFQSSSYCEQSQSLKTHLEIILAPKKAFTGIWFMGMGRQPARNGEFRGLRWMLAVLFATGRSVRVAADHTSSGLEFYAVSSASSGMNRSIDTLWDEIRNTSTYIEIYWNTAIVQVGNVSALYRVTSFCCCFRCFPHFDHCFRPFVCSQRLSVLFTPWVSGPKGLMDGSFLGLSGTGQQAPCSPASKSNLWVGITLWDWDMGWRWKHQPNTHVVQTLPKYSTLRSHWMRL